MSSTTVAIIGAGPAGICAARACLSYNLSITIFDKRCTFGGIWSGEDTPVFENLTTNTACFDTCISDVPPLRASPRGDIPERDNLCLSADEYREYLQHIVKLTPGMQQAFCARTEVVAIREVPDGYDVHYASIEDEGKKEKVKVEQFNYVIVASGAHHVPLIPPIPGLNHFTGDVIHVNKYRKPDQFAGKRVLVIGGSVSGCEAVADMAEGKAEERPASIALATRQMRHLLVKQKGVHVAVSELSNRFNNLRRLADELWSDKFKADLLEFIHSYTKHEENGLPAANVPVQIPGLLNYVPVHNRLLSANKKGLIEWNIGGVLKITESGSVVFNDGTEGEFDVIMLATGYVLHLPFLDKRTQELIRAKEMPDYLLDLADHSFHPELPRLAFIGVFPPGTSTAAITDMQSRYVSRAIAKPETKPCEKDLITAQEEYRRQRTSKSAHTLIFGFEVMDRFAQLGGFEVDLSVYKEWTKALIFGPLVPAQFRLFGEGKLEGALRDFEREIRGAGYVKGDNQMDAATLRQLYETYKALERNGRKPRGLQEAVEYLCDVNNFKYTV